LSPQYSRHGHPERWKPSFEITVDIWIINLMTRHPFKSLISEKKDVLETALDFIGTISGGG
jgi:hypothetical protein